MAAAGRAPSSSRPATWAACSARITTSASWTAAGPSAPEELAGLALALQARGAENINLVTPTHQAPLIFEALGEARRRGLRLPIVYNCGGYENPEFLRELAGLVDIYMPDFKYGTDAAGERLSGVREYARWCREGLREMHRQVGDLAARPARGGRIRPAGAPPGAAVRPGPLP